MRVLNKGSKGSFSRLLKLAVMTGVESAVKAQLDNISALNAQDQNGATLLILAVQKGHENICRLLLQEGADPEIEDKTGKKAKNYAEENGDDRIVHLLNERSFFVPALRSQNEYHTKDERLSKPVACPGEIYKADKSESDSEINIVTNVGDAKNDIVVTCLRSEIVGTSLTEPAGSSEESVPSSAILPVAVNAAKPPVLNVEQSKIFGSVENISADGKNEGSTWELDGSCPALSALDDAQTEKLELTMPLPLGKKIAEREKSLQTVIQAQSKVDDLPCLILSQQQLKNDKEELYGWELACEDMPPEENLESKVQASAIQLQITSHIPIDSGEGWSDIAIDLPEFLDHPDLELFRKKWVFEGFSKLFESCAHVGTLSETFLNDYVAELYTDQILKSSHAYQVSRPTDFSKVLQNDAFYEQLYTQLAEKVFYIRQVLEVHGCVIDDHTFEGESLADSVYEDHDAASIDDADRKSVV